MPIPIYQFEPAPTAQPYQSRYVGTLAQLAGAGDRARGQAVANVGENVVGSLREFAQYKSQAPRRELEAMHVQAARQDMADDRLFRQALSMASNGNLEEAMTFLDQQGGAGITAKQKLVSMAKAQREQHDEEVGEIGFRILQGGGSPDAVQRVMSDAVSRKLLSPEEAQQFHMMSVERPEIVPQAARQLMASSPKYWPMLKGETAAPGSAVRDAITHQIVPGSEMAPTRPDYTINGQRFSGRDGSPIGAPVPPQARPARPAAPARVGSEEDYLVRVAGELHKAPDDLTPADVRRGLQQYAVSKHVESLKADDLTPARREELVQTILEFPSVYKDLTEGVRGQIAPALRAAGFQEFGAPNQTVIATAERNKAAQIQRMNTAASILPPDEQTAYLAKETARIEASYRAQVGTTPRTPAAPPAATPAPAPAPAPPATPAPAPGAVPPAVATARKGQKPGVYKLSDGSAWTVAANGTISAKR